MFIKYSREYTTFVNIFFSATSLMLSRHRDHPLRGLWIGLFINHVRDVKGGLRTYWGTNNNLSITRSIGRIIKIGVAG